MVGIMLFTVVDKNENSFLLAGAGLVRELELMMPLTKSVVTWIGQPEFH